MRKNGPHDFTLLVASVNKTESIIHEINAESKSIRLTVEYGDCSAALAKAVAALHEANKYTASDTQTKMIEGYINSYVSSFATLYYLWYTIQLALRLGRSRSIRLPLHIG